MIPELPSVPLLESTSRPRLPSPPVPGMARDLVMSSGRAQEAEEFAAAMGQAYAISKAQNKHQKAKARARGRAAQRAAEKRKRR